MFRKQLVLLALVLTGCTGVTDYEDRGPPDGASGIPSPGDEDDPLVVGDPGSCCGAADLGLFTKGNAPCPEGTTEGFTAHADLIQPAPHTCTECSCSLATCTLPGGILAFPAPCADADGSTPLPFGPDPDSAWEGDCSQENAHPANQLCEGVPCAQSLWIPATTVTPCTPSTPEPSKPAWTWDRTVRQCKPLQKGCAAGQVCIPGVVPDGFDLCRYSMGDVECPPGYYGERSVLYMGASDDRGCEDCACGAPVGTACEAYVSVYKDGTCGTPLVQTTVSTVPLCLDVTPGSALGSLHAAWVTDMPGSCAPSGGTPIGDVQPAQPVTLCCPSLAN
jgi:hypothetical protein